MARKKHVKLETIQHLVTRLYVEEKLSILGTVAAIRPSLSPEECIRPDVVSKFLKGLDLLRPFDVTMKNSHNRVRYDVTCVGCKQSFPAKRPSAKYCVKCAPTPLAWRRLANYGLTEEAYTNMLDEQNHACRLCHTKFDDLTPHQNKQHTTVIDHDHLTGRVRGLLCSQCNVVIGYLEKRGSEWLVRATTYMGEKL